MTAKAEVFEELDTILKYPHSDDVNYSEAYRIRRRSVVFEYEIEKSGENRQTKDDIDEHGASTDD